MPEKENTETNQIKLNRRKFLAAAGLGAVITFSGCSKNLPVEVNSSEGTSDWPEFEIPFRDDPYLFKDVKRHQSIDIGLIGLGLINRQDIPFILVDAIWDPNTFQQKGSSINADINLQQVSENFQPKVSDINGYPASLNQMIQTLYDENSKALPRMIHEVIGDIDVGVTEEILPRPDLGRTYTLVFHPGIVENNGKKSPLMYPRIKFRFVDNGNTIK